MSLSSLLSIARGALLAQQRAVDVIGHNIANAETPGYTRQRVMLSAAAPQTIPPLGQIGRGVTITGIQRARSGFLDDSFRSESGLEARYTTLHQTLDQVSGILAEPTDSGISASLDDLIGSFQSLASNPTDGASRAVVVASAVSLADKLHSIDTRLQDVANNIDAQLQESVRDANSAITEISSLNSQIRAAGGAAPDLLDRRDQLIDKLSDIVSVRVIPQGQGTVNVLVGSMFFASDMKVKNYKPIFGVLWDMIGDKDLRIAREPNS
ncbi:MAG: flagellar hook-associated protein FlgK, partial [Gemmatimonadota bacterium]